MKVSSIQMDMAFASPDENYSKAEELIRKAVESEKPDVVVLPETWNLGFFPHENLYSLADREGERTKSLFSSLSRELDVNIVGGSVVRTDGDKVRNTSYVFSRTGALFSHERRQVLPEGGPPFPLLSRWRQVRSDNLLRHPLS